MIDATTPKPHRTLQVLVLLSVLSMLVGTILVILSADPSRHVVPGGETVRVLDHEVSALVASGQPLEVRVFGPGNFTITVSGDVPPERQVQNQTSLERGFAHVWWETGKPGERYVVEVTNEDEAPLAVSTEVETPLYEWIGWPLVAFGLLGFVFYKRGMS